MIRANRYSVQSGEHGSLVSSQIVKHDFVPVGPGRLAGGATPGTNHHTPNSPGKGDRPGSGRARSLLCIVLLLLASTGTASAQSADQIISRHLKAQGGAGQLRRIENVTYKGTVTNPATAQQGSFTLRLKRPDRLMMEMELSGFISGAAYNGRSAWRRDSREGLRTLTGAAGVDFKAEAVYRNDRFLDYKRAQTRVVLRGQEPLGDRRAFVIELTTQQAVKRRVWIDAQNWLLLGEEQPTESGTETISYNDYRRVDGVLEPFAIELRRGATVLRVTLDQIEHNQPMDDALFDFPRALGEALPDVPELLRAVMSNQEQLEKLKESYTFTEEVTEREVNKKGEVVETDAHTQEVYFYKGHKIERRIKDNGNPLSPDRDAKELKHVEKTIREIDEQERKAAERRSKGGEPEGRGDISLSLSVFLRMCDFTNARRERFRNREVIVFDFQPKPNVKARNLSESFAQRMSGVLWVDTEAKQIPRAEARLNEKLNAIGGVLSLRPGTAVIFEQSRINDEIWLPSLLDINLSVRALLFMSANLNQLSRFSDYRKFKAETAGYELKEPAKEKKP